MISNSAKLHSLLKSSLFCYRFEVASANCLLSWRRLQSRYNTNLSSRDFVEAINQKAKIHRYLKLQEPEEDSEYDSFLETRDSEQNLNVITESDPFDFGALSAEALSQEQACHESLVSRSIDKSEHKSVIDELLTTDPEEDPADRLRLSKVNRRHPPEYYSAQIIRFCKTGDTNSALSVFFNQMLETDRVQPSRFHFHMLLDGLAKVGDSENAFRVYKKMTDLRIPATQATYSRLFRSCAEDISTWYRKYKHFIPPIVVNHPGNSSLSLLQRKNLALQKALTPDMLPTHFGGPAVNKVYSLWRRLKEKEIALTNITYNSLILALAKAGDIHGCLRALDMMMTKSTSPSFHGSMKSQKRLTPDSFTLVSLLSAIEPANMKRNLILCHNNNSNNNDKDSLKQTASNADNVFRFSPFQLAIILWHDLLPYTHQSLVPHHFTLLANIMSLQNNCLDSNNSELLFVKNTQCKSFQDLLKYDALMDSKQTVYLPIHPSCTSSELATLMISQASQLSSLSSSMPSSQENPLRESTTVQKTSEVNHLDWENTMLALASPINVLLPTDKPIVICGPKNQSLAPWQRLALVGGLHGFIDVIENHYKLKPGLPFMTSLVRLLPYPNKLDNNYENDFDLWEKEFLSLLPRFKLRPDTGIYNALINRRTSAGVSPSHLLAEMTRQGLFPDQITWGCLARGCETVQSVEKLLNAFKIASMPSSTSSSISSSNELLNNNDAIMNTSIHSRIHSPVIRPSFTFFSTLLTTSEFNWELKTFIIEYMMRQAHVDELSDKNKPTKKKNRQNRSNNVKSKQEEEDEEEQQTSSKNDKSSNQYNGYVLDRRLIASLEIDISLFRELLVKGVIPKDGSPVPASETGGFYVPRYAVKSFYRFIKVYKSWLRETPVEKPC